MIVFFLIYKPPYINHFVFLGKILQLPKKILIGLYQLMRRLQRCAEGKDFTIKYNCNLR